MPKWQREPQCQGRHAGEVGHPLYITSTSTPFSSEPNCKHKPTTFKFKFLSIELEVPFETDASKCTPPSIAGFVGSLL